MKKPILSSLFPVAMLALASGLTVAHAETFPFAPAAAIPDGNAAGLTDSRTPATAINVITGLTLSLSIAGYPGGGYNGDLYAYVKHETPGGNGFTVLLNRVGTTALDQFGYADSGFNVTFSAAAANGDIHIYQTSPAYPGALNVNGALTGTWQPDARNVDPNTLNPGSVTDASPRTALLSSFNGLSAKGDWTLFVASLVSAGETMTLNSWSLDISGISGPFYWKGQTDGSWKTLGVGFSNWAADQAGTPLLALPLATDDVIFSANGAANQNTTLGQNFTIKSLTINDTVPVTINSGAGGPFTLTLSGAAGTGITVNTGADLTIGANVTLAGASDTIAVNGTGVAAISGILGGTNGVIKTGSGKLTLSSGANTYTGVTTISGGTLSIGMVANGGNVSDLGQSSAAATNLVFDGGVLQYTGATATSDRAFTINDGKLATFDVTLAGTNLTLAGATGAATTGALDKIGAGTLTLNGVNTYTGATTVNGGTLQVSGGGTITQTSSLTVDTGGTLKVDGTIASSVTATGNTIVGNSGTGTLNIQNGGTVTDVVGIIGALVGSTGTATVTGAGSTWSNSGALTVGYNGTGTLNIQNGGMVTDQVGNIGINSGSTGTVTVSGTGSTWSSSFDFAVGGSGTGTLNIQNGAVVNGGLSLESSSLFASSSGTLNIGGATANAGTAGTLNGGVVGVGPRANLNFNQTDTTTFAPQITGSVKVNQNGSGTSIVTGANTYTGGTTLNAGTLAAGNAKAFGSGNLTLNGGTLRTTGPLSVDIGAGNILFSGGTYLANVGGTVPGVNHDQLKTTGTANIGGGTLALVQQGGYLLLPGDKVKLLLAAGGVAGGSATGTPLPAAKVTGLSAFSASPLLVPVVNLYTDSVILEAMQGSFTAILGLTPNQQAVAAALDSVAARLGSKTGLLAEFNFLDTQPLSTLPGNLDKIAPDELTALFSNAVALANVQSANLQRRFADLQSGSPATTASGLAAAGSGPSFSGAFAGPKGKPSKEAAPVNDDRWGAFLTGSGEFTRVGSTTNAAGFHFETAGVTGGLDYRVNDHFAIGLDFGYVGTTASLVNGGSMDTDGGRLGIYATYFNKNFHVDAAVNGGLNSYKTKRVTPNNTVATGSPSGSEINILLSTGYDWKIGKLTVGPTASYQYTNVRLDGFTEAGAFLPLAIAGQTTESSRTSFGVHATYDLQVGKVIVRPEARLSWQHEFGATTSSITSRFANVGGNPFTVSGPKIGRDSLLVGAGASVQWSPRVATYVYYDGEIGRSNYNSHSVSAGFRIQF